MEPVLPETELFTDDVAVLGNLLRANWSLGMGKEPSIAWEVGAQKMNSRYASIFLYMVNRNTQVNSVDYRTLQRVSHVGIKVSSPIRQNFFEVHNEILRILMANRRSGKRNLGGFTYLEITNERFSNDLIGFYTSTLDVKMTSFNTPIKTAGMGDEVNRRVIAMEGGDTYEGAPYNNQREDEESI